MDYESDSGTTNKRRSSCCSEFEAQICCSYVISILSSLLIAGGFYLTILKWDHLWLVLPIVGSILIFIGACMYYSGQMDLRRRRRRRNDKIMAAESHGVGRRHRRRNNKDRGQSGGSGIGGDNLISSGLNDGRSLSQLSINMIPQYFANSDLSGSLSGPASNLPYSQILRVNGQSFLILPLSGDQTSPPTNINPNDTAISLQNLMVKMPSKSDQQSKPEGSDIYKKLEELPKRLNSKDYTTFTMEDCLPSSSSVSHDERNVIGLDNRATGIMNFNRETDPGSHSEYHFISNYLFAPGTSSSQHTNTPITTQSQPEAQTSRVAIGNGSIRMMGQSSGGHAGSQSRITNHRSSLIQHPVSTTSSIGQASSSSTSSSSRRPLLRRDTFNKDKPSVTIVKSTANQSDSLHAQTTVIADPSISSSSSVVTSSRSNANKRIENGNNRSVSNSLRLLSSQPGSCNSYSTSEVLVITQSNLSSNPNITSSSSSSSPTSSSSSSSTHIIPNSIPDQHHHRRTMDTNNSDETFIVMCGGNGGSTRDSDNLNFDDNLIEPGSATPPPSYEEVLSVETVGGTIGTRNSIAFDTL